MLSVLQREQGWQGDLGRAKGSRRKKKSSHKGDVQGQKHDIILPAMNRVAVLDTIPATLDATHSTVVWL